MVGLRHLIVLASLTGCRMGFDTDRSIDANVRAPVPCTTGSAMLFCDGFESGLAAWPYVTGDLAVVTDPVRTGVAAVRANVAAAGRADVLLGGAIASTVPQLWLRAALYFPSSSAFVRANIIEILNSSTNEQITIGVSNGSFTLFIRTQTSTSALGTAAPLDRWFCMEVFVTIDDVAGRAEVRVDGTHVASRNGIDTRPSVPFNYMGFAWVWSDVTQPASTLFMDDIEVATTPGACL